jgi:hypothetical protein
MHESNILVIHSPKMFAQISPSFAAHAFNQFHRSMHFFEIIRLGAWDPSGTNRESNATIVELFNEPALVEQIARETHDLYANEAQPADPDASSDPEDVAARKAWWTKDWTMFAEQGAQQVRQQLAFAADQGGRDSGVAPADSAHGFSARLRRQQSGAARLLH